jgi:hypothetical protein
MQSRRHPKSFNQNFIVKASDNEKGEYVELFRLKEMPHLIVLREITVFCSHEKAESLFYGLTGALNIDLFNTLNLDDGGKKFVIGPIQAAYGPTGMVFNEVYQDYEWVMWIKNTEGEDIPISVMAEIAYVQER